MTSFPSTLVRSQPMYFLPPSDCYPPTMNFRRSQQGSSSNFPHTTSQKTAVSLPRQTMSNKPNPLYINLPRQAIASCNTSQKPSSSCVSLLPLTLVQFQPLNFLPPPDSYPLSSQQGSSSGFPLTTSQNTALSLPCQTISNQPNASYLNLPRQAIASCKMSQQKPSSHHVSSKSQALRASAASFYPQATLQKTDSSKNILCKERVLQSQMETYKKSPTSHALSSRAPSASLRPEIAEILNSSSLNLSFLEVDNEEIFKITHWISNIPSVENIMFSLNLQGNEDISFEGTTRLAQMPNLTWLNLSHCHLDDKAVFAFAHNSTLSYLDISFNQISDLGIIFLAQCTEIQSLCSEGNHISDSVAAALASNCSLTNLGLGRNKISDVGCSFLARNTTLTLLDIRDNDFSDPGAEAFANNGSLTNLNLSSNRIQGSGVAPLFAGNNSLISLNLSCNHIYDLEINSFARNMNLTSLNINNNYLDNDTVQALKKITLRNERHTTSWKIVALFLAIKRADRVTGDHFAKSIPSLFEERGALSQALWLF